MFDYSRKSFGKFINSDEDTSIIADNYLPDITCYRNIFEF